MSLAVQVTTVPAVAIELDPTPHVETLDAEESHTRIASHQEFSVSTEGYVRRYFADIPIMAEVARCESTFRHINPTTGNVLRGRVNSSDVGVMQINTYYHNQTAERLGLDLLDIDDNLAYARYLYEREGTQPWSASRPCWGPQLIAMR